MALGYLCLFLVCAPNEQTGIPLTSNAGYSNRLNLFRNKGAGRKTVANDRKLDRRATLTSWSLERCFESDPTGLPSSLG
jgi:hypothetical protein